MNKLIFLIVLAIALGAIAYLAFPTLSKVVGLDTRVDLSETQSESQDPSDSDSGESMEPIEPVSKITKTETEWKEQLTSDQFYVTREHGTERAFSGQYWDNKKKGTYTCICCQLPLFSSETKYKSGTGWPSFYDPIKRGNVGSQEDRSLISVRTEVHCNRCEAHLGHVFGDGPKPTGLRYCINSASLNFVDEISNSEGTDSEASDNENSN